MSAASTRRCSKSDWADGSIRPNVCQPLVSVITNISFDHTQQLGNTLAAIAGEKAGIIKHGVPVISGVTHREPAEVVASAANERGCRLSLLGRDFDFEYRPPRHLETAPAVGHVDVRELASADARQIKDIPLQLIGTHQAANAAVGVATLWELERQGWSIPDAAIRRGFEAVRWPARIEVLKRRPTVVLDAAHNVASIEALIDVLEESFAARAAARRAGHDARQRFSAECSTCC